MDDRPDFAEFLKRIRAGDQQAAAELVQRFEPVIRREIRLRLEDRGLRRVLDSLKKTNGVWLTDVEAVIKAAGESF